MKRRIFLRELSALSVEELKKKRVQVAEDLMKGRFRVAVGQGAPGQASSSARRDLARIETELRKRDLAG
jgi:ribosomal protein L29